MADFSASQARFQMIGTRAAMRGGPIAEAIDQQIHAIENALESVPDFAFDLSKTLVESVCKTVLADIGPLAEPNWDAPKLLKTTTNRLALFAARPLKPGEGARLRGENDPRTCPDDPGPVRTPQRVRHGVPRARRLLRPARPPATLAAQAADTIVSFLYRIHHDALMQTPGARIYYEDHADFNEAFDNDNETIRVSELGLRPSEVLFKGDPGAYKAALNDHIAEQNGFDDRDDPIAPGDDGLEAG